MKSDKKNIEIYDARCVKNSSTDDTQHAMHSAQQNINSRQINDVIAHDNRIGFASDTHDNVQMTRVIDAINVGPI